MSMLEFILIPVGLVIGLGFTRFLDGLWLVIDSPNRYWVHTVWIVNKVMQPMLFSGWESSDSIALAPVVHDPVARRCSFTVRRDGRPHWFRIGACVRTPGARLPHRAAA